ISRYSTSVSSTPHTLVGCSKLASGYTGTLHEEILARSMQAIPEIGTDGKTISAVESKNPKVELYRDLPQKRLPEQIIERFQQKNETGTNIDQPPLAKNILSIRKGMTLRDALQSIFRMRKILQGQSVTFAISEEVKEDISANCVESLLAKAQFRALFNKKVTAVPSDVIKQLGLGSSHLEQCVSSAFDEIAPLRD